MPFACFGRTGPGLPQHWVDIDNRAAIVSAVHHVLDRGFSRIAFVGYQSADRWDDERAAGFTAGLASRGVPAEQAEILLVDEDGARERIRALLTGARPDAVVTGSDRLAAMIYGVAAELGLRIGSDLAVTGFDGSIPADLLYPTLTSISIPVDDIAVRVVLRALRQVSRASDGEPGEVVETSLRLGMSTGGG